MTNPKALNIFKVVVWLALLSPALPSIAQQRPVKQFSAPIDLIDIDAIMPNTPNPYLAFLPDNVTPDWAYWKTYARKAGKERAVELQRSTSTRSTRTIGLTESEPNNTYATANYVAGFGTGAGDDFSATLTGNIAPPPTPGLFAKTPEDDGSTGLAQLVSISSGQIKATASSIGDGPHGATTGDFDFFRLNGLTVGQVLSADTLTTTNPFDTYLTIYNAFGEVVAFNDDEDFPENTDSYVEYTIPASGTYYIAVGTFENPAPDNPSDPGSGNGFVDDVGDYSIFIGLDAVDSDYFTVDLEAGDILGVSLSGDASSIALVDPSLATRVSVSGLDNSFIFPASSPLPGGGNASIAFVAETTQRYGIRIAGNDPGNYSATVQVYRAPLESPGSTNRQILFLDFDGVPSLDTSIFGPQGTVSVSPLSSFLSGWGLGGGDLNAVIDAIIDAVEETLRDDILFPGGNNRGFHIELRNSRDHADPWGAGNVSRVIVGGTRAETGLDTIGIAQSIDPGDFDTTETAIVLLDLLSASASDPSSLNQYGLSGGKTKIDLVGIGVGNIVAHEAGHFFGNFHTENFFTPPNIMDQGGNLANIVGVGPDLILGTVDDVDVDFGPDMFVPNEGFSGTEDTLNTIAFGLASGLNSMLIYVDFTKANGGTGVEFLPFNNFGQAVAVAQSGALLRLAPGTSSESFVGGNKVTKPLTVEHSSSGSDGARIGAP